MGSPLRNKTIAILATDGFEQVELTEPKRAVEQAGATTRILSIKDGQIQATQIGAVGKGQLTQMIDKALGSQAA